MPTILVIGSINMDLVLRMERMPAEGESVIGQDYGFNPGGKGANAAVAAARLGGEVFFAGRVGKDVYGGQLRAVLEREGVNTTLLKETEDAPSGFAPILVQGDGQNRILVYPGANMRIPLEALDEIFSRRYDALMMQLEIPQEVVLEASRRAAAAGIPVVIDAGPAQPYPLEELKGLLILSPNETESTALTGLAMDTQEHAAQAARVLAQRSGARYVVIKMGARGAYVYGEGIERMVPAFAVDAVDPTAAGDTFTGALTLEYLRCGDILEAARCACAAGALAATRLGAQPSLPTGQQVRAFLKAHS